MIRNRKIEDVDIQLKDATIIIGSDIHIPFQDDKAVDAFIKKCSESGGASGKQVIILNGDVIDMFMLSRFTKGEGRNPMQEIEICREFLSRVRKAAPKADIYYVIGNHEQRLEKYVLTKAPELASLIEDVFSIIKVKDFDIKGCGSITINDNLYIKHGTLLGNKSGLSAIKEMENSYMSGASGHCFSEDVEVLTPNGWVKVIDLNIGDTVGTINKKTKEFQYNKVNDKFVYDNYDKLYRIKSQVMDLAVTDKHGLVGYNAYNNNFEEFTAEELAVCGKSYKIPCAAEEHYSSGVPLSESEIRLLVNISSDGCIEKNAIRFHLKKERKIVHLKAILDSLNIDYTESKQLCGTVKIYIPTKYSKELIDKYFKESKQLPELLRDCNKEQAFIILDEYSLTDGCKNNNAKNSYQIFSNKEQEIDLLQEIFAKNGIRSSKLNRRKNQLILTANLNPLTTITRNNVELIPYKGRVSCVSVDNGTLIVRSKGKTVVTQNTHRLCKYIARKSGKKFFWLETGCLCDMNPDYMIFPNWQQGFAEIRIENGKAKKAEVIEIENGEIL